MTNFKQVQGNSTVEEFDRFDLAATPVFSEFIERATGQWNKEQA